MRIAGEQLRIAWFLHELYTLRGPLLPFQEELPSQSEHAEFQATQVRVPGRCEGPEACIKEHRGAIRVKRKCCIMRQASPDICT